MSTQPRGSTRFLRELGRAQHRDQLILRAAALAYTTLFSLVPLLTVALVTVSRVQPERAEIVLRGVAAVLPFSSARVQATLTMLAERTASLGWIAVVFSAGVTLHLFYQIEEVVNAIWGVPHRRKWQWRLVSFLMVLVTGPLMLTALFSSLYWLYSLPGFSAFTALIRPLPILFAIATLTALYRWVPHTLVPWKAAFGGAGVATVALALVHIGFQAYIGVASELNVIYGSLTVMLFFLVSLFLFWLSVLLGAEASWVIGHPRALRPAGRSTAVFSALAEAHRNGVLTITQATAILGADTGELLRELAKPPEIMIHDHPGWRLAAAADDVSVGEVRERLARLIEADDPWDSDTALAFVFKELARADSSADPPPVSSVEGPRH